jgi:glycosyltransferase involved in cell wall biosynthesis
LQNAGALASSSDFSFALIENGYDEDSFRAAEGGLTGRSALNAGCITLLHSGVVYPSERDPAALFAALARLRARGVLQEGSFRLRFRAPLHAELLQSLAAKSGVESLIEVLPPIPYREALQEMLRADALVVMQGANCNDQIPAKVYEYFRARRPILGLADPRGCTASMLQSAGIDAIAKLEDSDAVEAALANFLAALHTKCAALPREAAVSAASRRARSRELAALMDSVVSERSSVQGRNRHRQGM